MEILIITFICVMAAMAVIFVAGLIRIELNYRFYAAVLNAPGPPSECLRLYVILPSYRDSVFSPRYWHLWTACQWQRWLDANDTGGV